MTRTENAPRVLRGGSWDYDVPSWVSAASRNTTVPANRHIILGFRTTLAGRTPR